MATPDAAAASSSSPPPASIEDPAAGESSSTSSSANNSTAESSSNSSSPTTPARLIACSVQNELSSPLVPAPPPPGCCPRPRQPAAAAAAAEKLLPNEAGAAAAISAAIKSVGGPRFKLLHEGDAQVCRLNHTRTVISKILSSKFLRRWEAHHLVLGPSSIFSKTPVGFLQDLIAYATVEDIYTVTRWECHQKYCIRIVIPDGSLLLQMSNGYLRDQWFHSLLWKKNLFKSRRLLQNTHRLEVLMKEIKNMVELSVSTPIQDECIYQAPLELISYIIPKMTNNMAKDAQEQLVALLTPLVEKHYPTPEMCEFFSKQCRENPRSKLISDIFTSVVQRILKHNVDFGKYPQMRIFLQDYIVALGAKNSGNQVIRDFVASMHGRGSTCPHPRILPNLVSVCLAAVYCVFENRSYNFDEVNDLKSSGNNEEENLEYFVTCLQTIASFEDWRPSLAQLLQPIPFPDKALGNENFTLGLHSIIDPIATDPRCEVHLMVLGIREGKDGWFHFFCPGNIVCQDEGEIWMHMLQTLFKCCCRRKHFLSLLNKMLGPCMLLALRNNVICQEVLCSMLELEVVESNDQKLQILTALQSTTSGNKQYIALCERQTHLRELQQKGGPRKLTLPSRSTDDDVAKLLSCGSFGNLECLSLAFTQVTSACAEQLIKLPSLKYLNLWSTQFGDCGLQLISEHLHKLQVLNLCETPVTDKGLVSLSAMKNLRKLNLNSTSLSAYTFEGLKQQLPSLQECDIRYTDAW